MKDVWRGFTGITRKSHHLCKLPAHPTTSLWAFPVSVSKASRFNFQQSSLSSLMLLCCLLSTSSILQQNLVVLLHRSFPRFFQATTWGKAELEGREGGDGRRWAGLHFSVVRFHRRRQSWRCWCRAMALTSVSSIFCLKVYYLWIPNPSEIHFFSGFGLNQLPREAKWQEG